MPDKKKHWIPAKEVRSRYGNASDMTLWRWSHDPDLGFPPCVHINNRRFWDEAKLDAFDAELVRTTMLDRREVESNLPHLRQRRSA